DLDAMRMEAAEPGDRGRACAEIVEIDRSFIADLDRRSDNQQMVSIMMHMARSLGLEILAEGVETEREIETLRKLGCYSMQGYHVAKPMALEETQAWIAAHLRKIRSQRGPRSIAV
ncbi:MAG: EAL domain-containing protein, partial [Pseudomonadota bacterium]